MKRRDNFAVEKLRKFVAKHRMKKRDIPIFIEAATLTVIYLLSFGILSLGRVQQTFFGISEFAFSSLQILVLTFVFAVIITLIIYSAYKKVIR